MIAEGGSAVLTDLFLAMQLTFSRSWPQLVRAWLYVPAGIVLMLLACFGVDRLLQLGSVSFPASVACLVVLFLALLLSERVLGEHRTRRIVAVIEVPASWSLRWMNVFFVPSFVQLPLSSPISGIEVLKIIAVFVIGFVVMMVFAAYLTRGLQLVLGSSKKGLTARAEELGSETDEIPMTTPSTGTQTPSETPNLAPPPPVQDSSTPSPLVHERRPSQQQHHPRANDSSPPSPRGGGDSPSPPPPATPHGDAVAHSRLPLPAQAPLALCAVLGLWVLGLLARPSEPLDATLRAYRTGARYTSLWAGRPGAGDVFSSVLDASIVALALPMYQYRRELSAHFAAIVVPSVLMSVGSLFAYPWVCAAACGIGARRSLAFAVRSLTLALAAPAAANLGGDANTAAALAIMSGIVGVLVGNRMLRWMGIPEDDYVTRGVTLGANSSAIATALLLRTDPRAAALSSLSMSLFGTITVLFTSIPPIVTIVRSLVGLS
ncbi:LrgB-like family-domain-containing protein [Biscogniauxia mediterranea]|nr:LrgB-like family-domain-containing protein [Biscogniauxia mediterranea]